MAAGSASAVAVPVCSQQLPHGEEASLEINLRSQEDAAAMVPLRARPLVMMEDEEPAGSEIELGELCEVGEEEDDDDDDEASPSSPSRRCRRRRRRRGKKSVTASITSTSTPTTSLPGLVSHSTSEDDSSAAGGASFLARQRDLGVVTWSDLGLNLGTRASAAAAAGVDSASSAATAVATPTVAMPRSPAVGTCHCPATSVSVALTVPAPPVTVTVASAAPAAVATMPDGVSGVAAAAAAAVVSPAGAAVWAQWPGMVPPPNVSSSSPHCGWGAPPGVEEEWNAAHHVGVSSFPCSPISGSGGVAVGVAGHAFGVNHAVRSWTHHSRLPAAGEELDRCLQELAQDAYED